MPCRHLFSITGITSPDSCNFSLSGASPWEGVCPDQEETLRPGRPDLQRHVRRELRDHLHHHHRHQVCRGEYRLVTGHKRGSGYYYPAPYRAALIRDCPASFLLTDDHICNSQHQTWSQWGHCVDCHNGHIGKWSPSWFVIRSGNIRQKHHLYCVVYSHFVFTLCFCGPSCSRELLYLLPPNNLPNNLPFTAYFWKTNWHTRAVTRHPFPSCSDKNKARSRCASCYWSASSANRS